MAKYIGNFSLEDVKIIFNSKNDARIVFELEVLHSIPSSFSQSDNFIELDNANLAKLAFKFLSREVKSKKFNKMFVEKG